jgi:hypothetical protein
MVTGGRTNSGKILDSTEFFDPATRSWSTGASLVERRAYHTATVTSDGSLILTGGIDVGNGSSSTSSAEALVQPTTPPRHISNRRVP